MYLHRCCVLNAVFLLLAGSALAQTPAGNPRGTAQDARQTSSPQAPARTPPADPQVDSAIKAVLQRQAADWNRGDLDAFAQGYKHAPDILFMGGNTIRRGYEQMLARYKQSYPDREHMGVLTFSELEVQPLHPQFATATGHFHLERTAAGGGNADGFFLLVLEKTAQGWKVVRDDTTPLPAGPR